jgi:hypothetical protein
MTPFERGLVAHLVADWVLQNDWMARNKIRLWHPAAWTHAAIQGLCLGLALGWLGGVVLGVAHLLVDTRVPVAWWMRWFKRCEKAPEAGLIAIWLDQTVHIGCIALWVAMN